MNYENQELRLYALTNFYLSPIQHGIQTGHAAVDLVMSRADQNDSLSKMVRKWANDYKTFIVLNGGDNEGIKNATVLLREQHEFPWKKFREPGLGNIVTVVAVILPEEYFNASKEVHPSGEIVFYKEKFNSRLTRADNPSLYDVIALLKSAPLAR